MRLDKFIWAVRLYKTRSMASKACSGDKVKLNGEFSKPGKTLSTGNVIAVKVLPIWKTYQIIDVPKSRVGAKLVNLYVVETTPEDDLQQLKQSQLIIQQNKSLGIKGRPTKRDRRTLDKMNNG